MSVETISSEYQETWTDPDGEPAANAAAAQESPPRIAYIMSRFPKLTETFVLFEMLALQRLGAQVEVYPLLRARNTGTHPEAAGIVKKLLELLRRPDAQPVMHSEAEPFVARAHFMPFFNLAIARAQLHFALRRPATYFGALWTLIRANWGSANFLLGGLALFPKAVYFALVMKRQNIHHVHAHFANHPAAAAYIIHRLTGIPYSFTAHGADLQVDQHMLREKVAAAKYVVSISQDNQQLIERVCGHELAERVRLVRCGVDTSIFRDGSRETDDAASPALHIVCIGTLYEVKGQTHLIEACRILTERNVPVRCDLVGDGPLLEQLQQQVESADLAANVNFLGRRTRQEIAELLQTADVLVAPSVPTAEGRREGIPVVLMEAQGSGLPVVASNISGIPELVEHEKTGLLVPPADPVALANALARLTTDPQRRHALGHAGREKILDQFDLHKNAGRLLELFCAEVPS